MKRTNNPDGRLVITAETRIQRSVFFHHNEPTVIKITVEELEAIARSARDRQDELGPNVAAVFDHLSPDVSFYIPLSKKQLNKTGDSSSD
jgi:hypothetical protein